MHRSKVPRLAIEVLHKLVKVDHPLFFQVSIVLFLPTAESSGKYSPFTVGNHSLIEFLEHNLFGLCVERRAEVRYLGLRHIAEWPRKLSEMIDQLIKIFSSLLELDQCVEDSGIFNSLAVKLNL